MSDTAGECAPDPDREVPDLMCNGLQESAQWTRHRHRLELKVACQRANGEPSRFFPHVWETWQQVYVNEICGTGQPEIHGRHQALTAGEYFGVGKGREESERLTYGRGGVAYEGGRLYTVMLTAAE